MKTLKKFFRFIILNLCLFLFTASSHSLISGGMATVGNIKKVTLFVLLVVNFIAAIIKKKKGKIKFRKITITIMSALFAFTVAIIPLSSGYQLYVLSGTPTSSNGRGTDEVPTKLVLEKYLEDNTYLEIYENKVGGYGCATVVKTPLSYHIAPLQFSWKAEDFSEEKLCSLFLSDIPHINDDYSYSQIFYAALNSNDYRAYFDDKEMTILSDGNITLAYFITGDTWSANRRNEFRLENHLGEIVYQTTV